VLCVWRSSTAHVYALDALSLSLSLSLIYLTAQGKAISVVRACGHNRQRNIRLVDQLNIIDRSEAHQSRTIELIVSSANEPDDPTTKSETACIGIGMEAAVSQP